LELLSASCVFSNGATNPLASNRNSQQLVKGYRVMILLNLKRAIIFALLCAVTFITAQTAMGQASSEPTQPTVQRDDDANLEIQLYLILASNREVEDSKLPAALDPVVKRLRDSLPFKHYNLAGTFLNRVKNNGRLDMSWVGGPFPVQGSPAQSNPSFSQFTSIVRLAGEPGQEIVRLTDFRFGTRVPIVTGGIGPTNASTGAAAFPVIQYEPVGLRTDLTMREGSIVIAGTLTVGPSGDAIVVVVSARRAN
jgi:hypothetical protein